MQEFKECDLSEYPAFSKRSQVIDLRIKDLANVVDIYKENAKQSYKSIRVDRLPKPFFIFPNSDNNLNLLTLIYDKSKAFNFKEVLS